MDPGYGFSNEGLLLDLEQIRKLQKINPNVVSWIMRAQKKNSKRDTISTLVNLHSKKLNKAVFKIDVLTIISAFILMMAGMLLSYLLLRAGLTITGGIFTGGYPNFRIDSFSELW